MSETPGELPSPSQVRAFNEASRAAWRASRMREASHALVTGNLILSVCLPGIGLFLLHCAPLFLIALILCYLACLTWAIRRIGRERGKSLVTVTDRLDDLFAAKPRQAILYFVGVVLYFMLCSTGWRVLRRHISTEAHLASLAIVPLMCIGFFLYRAVTLAFWEYFLFALCIPMAYLPILLRPEVTTPLGSQGWGLVVLSASSMVLVILGSASLHHRWEVWSRSLEDAYPEEVDAGATP